MGSPKSQIAVLAAGVATLMLATPAPADTPPPVPPGTPSINQYVETVPTSAGGAWTQVGKQRTKPLPKKLRTQLRARSQAVTERLEAVATSSTYGAPQRELSPQQKTSSQAKTGSQPGEVRAREPEAADPLSAAVSAANDTSDSHVFWLLAGVMVVTTSMVWATARRHRG